MKASTADTIVAVSTPVGEGGISIVRLSGNEAIPIAGRIFRAANKKSLLSVPSFTLHYGHIVKNAASGGTGAEEAVDEVLVTVMRAPRTYTKEDIVEVNCHGGIVAAAKILELAMTEGARVAEPGEFTKRAFLNGRIDLAQAEAVADIVSAKTQEGLKASLAQLKGRLSAEIRKIRDELLDVLANIEADLDFPGEDIETASANELTARLKAIRQQIKNLLEDVLKAKILREGVKAVICGKPNVGKSSLMNAMLGHERVIVTSVPGTTRDSVEEWVNAGGIAVRLFDTAGLRQPGDEIERLGVEKTREELSGSDIAILVLDGSAPLGAEDTEIAMELAGRKLIVTLNKNDLPLRADMQKVKELFRDAPTLSISAKLGTNLGTLRKTLAEMVWGGKTGTGSEFILVNARHAEALKKAGGAVDSAVAAFAAGLSPELPAIDVKEALEQTGLITGETFTEDLLDRIFSSFCIGK